MSHLEVDRVLAVIAGDGESDEHAHLELCTSCRHALQAWSSRTSDLRELESNAVDPSEMHNLRVLFRELGPVSTVHSWRALLVRGSTRAAAPVRGGLSASFQSFRAGQYEIVVQMRPSAVEGRFDIQGQVADEGGRAPECSHVILTSPGGHLSRAELDTFGEFRLTSVPRGPCRLVWLFGDTRIDLEELEVGGRDGDAGG